MKDRKVMPLKADANMVSAAYMLLETMPHGTPERAKKVVAAIWEEMAKVSPPARTSGATALQMRAHEIIADYIADNNIAPSYEEIGAQLGKPKADVFRILTAMKNRGILTWRTGARRSLRLLVQPGEQINGK